MAKDAHDAQAGEGERPPVHGWWRPVVLILAILALAVAALVFDLADKVGGLRDRVEGLGRLAPLAFILVRAGAAVAVIPGSPVTAMAGILFDPVLAIACVSAGKTLGACVSFLVARYFARDAVARWLATKAKYRRLDDLVAKHGAEIVALMRLVPVIPFNVQNYAFGLTRVRFGTYLFCSWLCMLPAAVFVVSGTVVARRTLAEGLVPWGLVALHVAALGTMACLGLYALLLLRKKMKDGP